MNSNNYEQWRNRFETRAVVSFDNAVATCGEQRGLPFLFPIILSGKGHGPYYEDSKKNVYLDLSGSIGVHILGCAHPIMKDSLASIQENGFVMQTHLFPGQQYVKLIEKINSIASLQLKTDRCWLTPTGMSALEIGLRIATNSEKKNKKKIITFRETYFANSLNKWDFAVGKEKNETILFLTFPQHNDDDSVRKFKNEFESLRARLNEEYCAFVFEPFLGEGGFRRIDKLATLEILKELNKNNVKVIADETQTFMRSTEPFLSHLLGFSDFVDIVIVGKALQSAAVLFKKDLSVPVGSLSGTFAGSTSALAAAFNILDYLTSNDFYGVHGRIFKINRRFVDGITKISSQKNCIKIFEIESCGLMCSFSIADGEELNATDFVKRLFKAGVLATVCGIDNSRIRFNLPAIIEDHEIDISLKIIEQQLKKSV